MSGQDLVPSSTFGFLLPSRFRTQVKDQLKELFLIKIPFTLAILKAVHPSHSYNIRTFPTLFGRMVHVDYSLDLVPIGVHKLQSHTRNAIPRLPLIHMIDPTDDLKARIGLVKILYQQIVLLTNPLPLRCAAHYDRLGTVFVLIFVLLVRSDERILH